MKCFIHLFIQHMFENLLYARHLKLASGLSQAKQCLLVYWSLVLPGVKTQNLIPGQSGLRVGASQGLITSGFGTIIENNHVNLGCSLPGISQPG